MIRVGVLGAGIMGSDHILAVKKLAEWKQKEIAVTAIADRMKERREKAAQIWPEAAIYEEADELLEKEELDAVHICLPSYLHAEYAIRAMEKGIPVLLEKPACLTEKECGRLLETQKRTGVKVMVGQVLRFFPEYRLLKELFEKKTYGELKGLVMQRLSQNVLWGYQNWFHDEKKSGSVVLDLHVHDADFIRYLLGEPEGIHVIDPHLVVMEIKVAGAFPLWITHFLSKEHIYHSSFSKYGTAYMNMLHVLEKAA